MAQYLVRLPPVGLEDAHYGSPVQVVVSADDATDARTRGARILQADADTLEVIDYGKVGESEGPGMGNWADLPPAHEGQ